MIDFAVDEGVDDDAGSEAVVVTREALICWIRTRAWREMLKVEVCVIKKRVSICLLILAQQVS